MENKKMSNDLLLSTLRGTTCRCPNCGIGKLFTSYLKPVESCSNCAEPIALIRADDGPAWLTMVIAGHILAPILLSTIPDSTQPMWLLISSFLGFALLLSLLILPFAKGTFIGILWKLKHA